MGDCVPTTLISRLKPNGVAKSRLCVIGLYVGFETTLYVSAYGGAVPCLCFLSRASNLHYDVIAFEVSQVFLQEDELPPKDKYSTASLCVAYGIILEWSDFGPTPSGCGYFQSVHILL